jgi:hypothetical protein
VGRGQSLGPNPPKPRASKLFVSAKSEFQRLRGPTLDFRATSLSDLRPAEAPIGRLPQNPKMNLTAPARQGETGGSNLWKSAGKNRGADIFAFAKLYFRRLRLAGKSHSNSFSGTDGRVAKRESRLACPLSYDRQTTFHKILLGEPALAITWPF